ncbi:MAG: hypothetical protein F4Z95_05340 [Gammaproteobacteria bacterium]|nr:hypothetical protein [Gammaproteobacteria bacterium]MYC23070.1 hypothetical protein [Caldilineaceae bacterium SB0662_bin_25]
MDFLDKQIAPPKDWVRFEDLCLALFKQVWNDPLAQKNGRRGQRQNGVDIFGSPASKGDVYWGVQCKAPDTRYGGGPTLAELEAEVEKAENFSPKLDRWILATTAPRDATLQQFAREISVERREKDLFSVHVLGWDEILDLLAGAPDVISNFYPEHSAGVDKVIRALRSLPLQEESERLIRAMRKLEDRLDSVESMAPAQGIWAPVEFEAGRDLGPALMGRPLGPSDAVACPRLDEADTVLAQLEVAYSVRIAGEPGAGKSVCAYQAALTLARAGKRILRLSDPRSLAVGLNDSAGEQTLYLVDNAHLMQPYVLNALEEAANPDRMVLSIHNAVRGSSNLPGAITVDAQRAVRTIASALRTDLHATLRVVRRADDSVGERMLDIDLSKRIDEAAIKATVPWQFCFILGGGWRRAKQVARNARVAGADFVLAAIAAHQMASRDAPAHQTEIIEHCRSFGLSQSDFGNALGWLVSERLILGEDDCRCPHQRFSAVVLSEILAIQDKQGRKRIAGLINRLLTNHDYPLAGLRLLLHELRFGSINYQWNWIVQDAVIRRLASRCWQAQDGEERAFAALVLEQLLGISEKWARELIEPNAKLFSAWISEPGESAYGLKYLLNVLAQRDEELAREVVSASDPDAVAEAFSTIEPKNAYGICELMSTVGNVRIQDWNARMMAMVDKDRLRSLAQEWTYGPDAYRFAKLCRTLVGWDEELALKMAEDFVPAAREILARDPVDGFRKLDNIATSVLRAFDVLGVYVGVHAPDNRRKAIARSMCSQLDAKLVADQVLKIRKRDFQAAAHFLHFFFDWAPRKFSAMLAYIKWDELDVLIGDDWENLTHEALVLLGTFSMNPPGRQRIQELVVRNLDRIEQLPPRLAVIAPEAALRHARNGRYLRLVQYDHVDWRFGGLALAVICQAEPDLLQSLFAPFEKQLAKALSAPNSSFFDESELLIRLLLDKAPDCARRVLEHLEIRVAENGWMDCLRKSKGHRASAALLIEGAIEIEGPVGDMARRLRKRFPKSSLPPARLTR